MRYYKTFLGGINQLYEVNSCDDNYPLEMKGIMELFGKQFPFQRFWIDASEYITLLDYIKRNNDNMVKDPEMAETMLKQMSQSGADINGFAKQQSHSGLIL